MHLGEPCAEGLVDESRRQSLSAAACLSKDRPRPFAISVAISAAILSSASSRPFAL